MLPPGEKGWSRAIDLLLWSALDVWLLCFTPQFLSRKTTFPRGFVVKVAELPQVQRLGNVARSLPPMDCCLAHSQLCRHLVLGEVAGVPCCNELRPFSPRRCG